MAVRVIKNKSYMESIIDAPQEVLNPRIWDGEGKLLLPVKEFILKTIEGFELEKYQRIAFVGSNTGYQYTDTSDVDIHIWIEGVTEEQLKVFQNTLPRDLKLPGTEHPVQFYVVGVDESKGFQGKGAMYDVEKNQWIVEPTKADIKVPYSYLMSLAKFFIEGSENRIREYESDSKELLHLEAYLKASKDQGEKEDIQKSIDAKKQEIESDLDALEIAVEILYGYRSDSYSGKKFNTALQMGEGNESTQNAVFKIIEELGTWQRIKNCLKTRGQK